MQRLEAVHVRNMIAVLRNAFQCGLGALFPYFAVQVKKFLVKLAFILALGLVIIFILWLTMAKLKDSSMDSEQDITMVTGPWWKLPQVIKGLKDILVIIATLMPYSEPLTEGNLVKHRDQLGSDRPLLQTCFNMAINGFIKEPIAVQQNAQLLIQCEGLSMEFLAGEGHCKISVLVLDEKIQYIVKELTAEIYHARMHVCEEPWSRSDLLRVKHNLETWGFLSETLRKCLQVALQKFGMETWDIQSNANMLVDCGGHTVKFVSGKKEVNIYIYSDNEGTIHYQVRHSSVWTQAARWFAGTEDHLSLKASNRLQLGCSQCSEKADVSLSQKEVLGRQDRTS